jgi:voltage-gated potassium channel Kch
MVAKLLTGLALMAACVVIHASGVTVAVRCVERLGSAAQRFRHWTLLFIGVAAWVVVLHLLEIVIWALYYLWQQAMPNMPAALYFSAVTYTTTGYGDLVLPEEWRLLGAVEALTGILMCGWSTGFFFAIVSRMFDAKPAD